MRKVSSRAILALVLALAVVVGLAVFVVQFFLKADDWIVFPGSPHVYTGGNLSTGTVTDRSGVLLLQNTQDGKRYADDPALRTATLHLLGDREGYIPATMLNSRVEDMLGYSKVNGLYSLTGEGRTLELTVSAQVQTAAWEALAGRKGTVGVYNYQTGEVLCMVSSPAYDPDAKPEIVDGDPNWEGVYLNRFCGATYVPGSIFKLVTLSAALESIPDLEAMSFYCGGYVDLPGGRVTCTGVHGTQTLQQALANSCNCAFAAIATQLGADTLQQYADAWGISQSLDIDGVTTRAGHFDTTDTAPNALAWAGIGQYTDLINPCQYLTVLGGIANGGQGVRPYVVASVKSALGLSVYQAEPVSLPRVISAQSAQTIAECMSYGVQTVYGSEHFGGLDVCAKSGTAEVEGQTPHALFAGFVRDAACPVAFVITVENAGSGAANCIPIAASVLAACVEALA